MDSSELFWWAFSSCTKELHTTKTFLGQGGRRTLFHITCARAVEIEAYSSFPEAEVLLFPCTWLQVTSKLPEAAMTIAVGF